MFLSWFFSIPFLVFLLGKEHFKKGANSSSKYEGLKESSCVCPLLLVIL